MTVKELIEQLEKMPQDLPVYYYDGDNGWCAPQVQYIENAVKSIYNKEAGCIGAIVDLTSDC